MLTVKRPGWWPILLLLVGMVGCGRVPEMPPGQPGLWEGVTPVGRILANPAEYDGKEVLLLVYFRGQDLLGEAGGRPPLSQEDMVFADPTGAIYAEGTTLGRLRDIAELRRTPLLAAREILLRLRSRVRRTTAGQPYLEVLEGEQVEGLPIGVVLGVTYSGTIAGLTEQLMVLRDGAAYYVNWNLRRSHVFRVESGAVADVLRKLRPLLERGTVGTAIPDGSTYRVTAWETEKWRTVTIHVPTAPPEADEVLKDLGRWLDQGRQAALRR